MNGFLRAVNVFVRANAVRARMLGSRRRMLVCLLLFCIGSCPPSTYSSTWGLVFLNSQCNILHGLARALDQYYYPNCVAKRGAEAESFVPFHFPGPPIPLSSSCRPPPFLHHWLGAGITARDLAPCHIGDLRSALDLGTRRVEASVQVMDAATPRIWWKPLTILAQMLNTYRLR